MRRIDTLLASALALLLLVACGGRADVRPYGPSTDRASMIFPDYQDVTIPCNIAPLNFYYTDPTFPRPVTVFSCGTLSVTFRGK